ncbi:MAG: non-hydrolyzing UDP-N-acetylglucosamine 2-epimerase [Stellaceae bacterium]
MSRSRLLIVLGTRPEAIKLAPVVLAARAHKGCEVAVCHTGQHADMCEGVLALFGIAPDVDLEIMKPRQSLTDVTAAVLAAMDKLIAARKPDWLIVQGDTTSAFAAALAGFYHKLPVAHVEAGLRTGNILAPWPEEMNRRLITALGQFHFAPLASNAENLRREGVGPARILVTGNTGIDALKWLMSHLKEDKNLAAQAQGQLDAANLACLKAGAKDKIVLVTAHRRESFGAGLTAICGAVVELARRFADRHFIYPVHPNPVVRDTVERELKPAGLANLHLIEPLEYLPFVALMARAELILTDSGGIQEEAPSIAKRVVVLRELTERKEGIETGLIRLAGTDRGKIVAAAADALEGRWPASAKGSDVYGDGHAAERIVEAILSASGV